LRYLLPKAERDREGLVAELEPDQAQVLVRVTLALPPQAQVLDREILQQELRQLVERALAREVDRMRAQVAKQRWPLRLPALELVEVL
jgi:hypothetical protein